MRNALVLAVLLTATPALAQVQSRPTDPPIVTAQNESWYQQREPLDLGGEVYYPAGAVVFFNGNTMVRSGHYNGVPLYADATLEPYSVVFVPIGRGLMQPYERPRRGALAGTSGSRTPSFPVGMSAYSPAVFEAAIAPTALPRPIGAISVFTPERAAAPRVAPVQPAVAPATVTAPVITPAPIDVQSVLRPENNDGVWVRFAGQKWVHDGWAVPLTDSGFVMVGQYAGFPVFNRRGATDTIYIPTTDGVVAPYRRKP